MIIATDSEGLG